MGEFVWQINRINLAAIRSGLCIMNLRYLLGYGGDI